MKTQILLMVVLTVLIFGCTKIQEKTAEEILEAPKLRGEIFEEILTNDKYISEFTNKMAASEKGKTVFTINIPMMRLAWESDKMDSLINTDMKMMETMINRVVNKMESDTNTCSMMCSKVMENEHLKSYVIKHACSTPEKKKK